MRSLIGRGRKGRGEGHGAPAGEPSLSVAQKAARARLNALAGEAGAAARPSRPLRRDPAPSRMAYKLHRLWLTPFFRLFLRVGLPMLLSFALGWFYISDPARKGALTARLLELGQSIKTWPEFMVRLVAIKGATPEVAQQIRARFAPELPVSSFDLDLEMLQAEIAELDIVESAAVMIRPGGVLEIDIEQRQPVAVWRYRGGLALLDRKGNAIAGIDRRAARPDLPLLAGQGAQDQVPEALALIRAAAPIAPRLRGLVRVGERRWDMVLADGVTIKLPERDPLPALAQVLALDAAQDLLARAVTTIDMRNPLRPTLRLAPEAQVELRRIRAIELGDPS